MNVVLWGPDKVAVDIQAGEGNSLCSSLLVTESLVNPRPLHYILMLCNCSFFEHTLYHSGSPLLLIKRYYGKLKLWQTRANVH
jgi:hypothetical protein